MEFKTVMKEKCRLTKNCGISCEHCRLGKQNNGENKDCVDLIAENPEKFEEIITQWAKDFPRLSYEEECRAEYEKAKALCEKNGINMKQVEVEIYYKKRKDCDTQNIKIFCEKEDNFSAEELKIVKTFTDDDFVRMASFHRDEYEYEKGLKENIRRTVTRYLEYKKTKAGKKGVAKNGKQNHRRRTKNRT